MWIKIRGKVQEGKREKVKMGLNGEEFSSFRREGRKGLKDKAESIKPTMG